MSKALLVGDTHFGHNNICKYRTQFSTAEEHHNVILDNILSVAGKRDTLWLMGDIAFDEKGFEYFIKICEHVGNVKVIMGNHDMNDAIAWAFYATSVYGITKHKKCWMSHAPIHSDELRGSVNIHGHTHFKSIDDPRYYCVSMEQIDYKPINLQTIIATFRERGVYK